MLNMRSRVFFVVSIVVLFILAAVIFILVINKSQTPTEETPGVTDNGQIDENNFDGALLSTQPTVVPAGTKVKTATTEEMEQNAAIKLAKIFTERYGTYSTHGSYENIKDVLEISTDSLAQTLSAKVPESDPTAQIGVYRGVTVQAIATELVDWQKTEATVSVSAVKSETSDGQTVNSNIKAEIILKKVNDEWLVDGFVWK